MKLKAAFVDHSFHKKTRPVEFLKKLLSNKFQLDYFYDESWIGGEAPQVTTLKNYEYIFYLEYIHNVNELNLLGGKKIVWIPMYDGVVGMPESQLLEFRRIPMKVVAFSKKLYEWFVGLGFQCHYVQYFPDPNSLEPVHDYSSKRAYFWNRIPHVSWDVVKILIGDEADSVTYINNPDPNLKIALPTDEDIKKYHIRMYKGFLEREKYLSLVSKANIYIAPRVYEGIGQSFLKALARGQCVIASDTPTMNEYITDGVNGYLYDLRNPKPIDLGQFDRVGKNARKYMEGGFFKYEADKERILDFVIEESWPESRNHPGLFVKKIYPKLVGKFRYFGSKARGMLGL